MKSSKLWVLGVAFALAVGALTTAQDDGEIPFTETFFEEDCHLKPRGSNPYFLPLQPGCYLVLAGTEEGDEGESVDVAVFIKVLPGIRVVAGVKCAIVREMEWEDGELVEVSWNYFAICREHGGIFYYGEDVDDYEDGEVVGHGGSWLAGADGARPGLIMPGLPLNGARYFQELAPGIAEDRAEHISNTETVETPAGAFANCLVVVETSALDAAALSIKAYARGIGLIRDDALRLVSHGCNGSFEFEPAAEDE